MSLQKVSFAYSVPMSLKISTKQFIIILAVNQNDPQTQFNLGIISASSKYENQNFPLEQLIIGLFHLVKCKIFVNYSKKRK